MTMRIEANARVEREESVRNDCQALLLTRLSTLEKRRIILRLAQSWERSGNLKKAIAVAWMAVPMTKSTEQDVAELLALIIRNAKKSELKTICKMLWIYNNFPGRFLSRLVYRHSTVGSVARESQGSWRFLKICAILRTLSGTPTVLEHRQVVRSGCIVMMESAKASPTCSSGADGRSGMMLLALSRNIRFRYSIENKCAQNYGHNLCNYLF